jgi:putative intracellular protease/amidase
MAGIRPTGQAPATSTPEDPELKPATPTEVQPTLHNNPLAPLTAVAGWVAKGQQVRQDVQHALFPAQNGPVPFLPTGVVARARDSGDPQLIAHALHELATGRSNLVLHNDQTRVDRTKELFQGLSADQVAKVRAAYIDRYGIDPELSIRSDGWGQPRNQLPRSIETEMVGAMNHAALERDSKTLSGMLDKAKAGTLTQADRAEYFSMLPRWGLYDAPTRAPDGDHHLDSIERTLLDRAWGDQGKGVGFDDALKTIESAMPPADLTPKAPRERSIAAIASSHGAQWQELMDWAKKMEDQGYHVQVFTPEGRPVGFQRDSLSVFKLSSGFGSPEHLDPAGPTGDVAKRLLANTAPASKFDPSQFGAVYLAGGLGFNEDIAVAKAGPTGGTVLTPNPNVEQLMNAAVADRLPIVALCHGPTLLTTINMDVNGHREPLNKGLETASLPPFEGIVGASGRKEIQFTFDVNTHDAMEAAGGQPHVFKDIFNLGRVVKAEKAGQVIITGPAPQSAAPLADATIEALRKRW